MRFFSKITVLLNCCFIVAVLLWYIEMNNRTAGNNNLAIPLPWLEGIFVILGYGAIVVNALFLVLVFIFYAFRTAVKIPRWIIIFNLIIFLCQLYFHFIFK